MRRLTLALVALSIPAASLSAQLIGSRGTRGAQRPAEKPPQAPGIHDARLYNRYRLSRFSLEASPMLSYMQTTGFIAEGIPANYWSLGDATQLMYRAAPSLYLTTTFTGSALGGPFALSSAEAGVRVKPWASMRFAPFAEARMSYAFTTGFAMPSGGVPVTFLYRAAYGDFTSGDGRGGVVGLGMDGRLTDRFALTTTLSHSRLAMEGRSMSGVRRTWDYSNNATRLTVGVRYNHGRWMDAR
jgi:hypothetical protein